LVDTCNSLSAKQSGGLLHPSEQYAQVTLGKPKEATAVSKEKQQIHFKVFHKPRNNDQGLQ